MTDFRTFLLSWSFEPTVILGLALGVALYVRGWRRLRARGRGGRALKPWRAWCYGAGIALIAMALLSPIGTFTELFFSMHMIQHLLLIMFAAPLILLGAPVLPVMWAFDRGTRRGLGRVFFHESSAVHRVFHFLTRPGIALTVFIVVLIVWHHPALYDAAQGRTIVHDLEHALFFGTALLFWWPVIHPTGGRRRLGYGAAILYIFPAKIAGFVLGAALTLTDTAYYETYIRAPRLWGISALADQQAGGLIMWVVGGLLYIVPLLFLVLQMMRQDEGHVWVPEVVRARDDVPGAPAAPGAAAVARTPTA